MIYLRLGYCCEPGVPGIDLLLPLVLPAVGATPAELSCFWMASVVSRYD